MAKFEANLGYNLRLLLQKSGYSENLTYLLYFQYMFWKGNISLLSYVIRISNNAAFNIFEVRKEVSMYVL